MSDTTTTEVKAFTSKKPRIPFEVDGESFEALAVLPGLTFGDFAEKVNMVQRASADYEGSDKLDLSLKDTVVVMLDAVELGLTPESAQRMAARLSDPDNPVDIATLSGVLVWLLENYSADKGGASARPTQPTSDSPIGSEPTGDGSPES